MTLEKRASICSHCLADTTRSCHNDCTYYERYKAYVEQKELDDKECEKLVGLAVKEARKVFVERACEFLKVRLFHIVKAQSKGEIDVINRSDLIEEFKKIMED